LTCDLRIKQDLNDELPWEPAVDAAGVGVMQLAT